jgi:hypothetical protein
MVRTVICALAGLVLCAGSVMADEIKGKVKSVNPEEMTVTVVASDGSEHTVHVGNNTKVIDASGKDLRHGIKSKQLKEGTLVSITTEMVAGKNMAVELKLHKERE